MDEKKKVQKIVNNIKIFHTSRKERPNGNTIALSHQKDRKTKFEDPHTT